MWRTRRWKDAFFDIPCVERNLGFWVPHKNWFQRRQTIYANYHLFKIPYVFIDNISNLENIRDGFFAGDEFWLHLDARTSVSKKNQIVSNILLKSRKRSLTYCVTAQILDLLDKRIRKVMDFCLLPNERIICKNEIKNIIDIKEGDKVLSHIGRFKNVSQIMSRDYEGDMIEITPFHLRMPTKVTEDHPIFIAKPIWNTKYLVNKAWERKDVNSVIEDFFVEAVNRTSERLGKKREAVDTKRKELKAKVKFEFSWVKAKDLKIGDLIVFPIIKKERDMKTIRISDYVDNNIRSWKLKNGFWSFWDKFGIKDEIKIDNDFLKFIGYYLGDGGLYKGNISIALCYNEMKKAKEVSKLFENILGMKPKIVYKNKKSCLNVHLSCKPFEIFLEKLFGKGCENKRLPFNFLILPKEKQEHILDGYLKSDGHKMKNCDGYSFSTVSELLVHQISQIVLRLGKKITIKREPPQGFGKLYCYYGYISKRNFNSFLHDGFFITPIKTMRREKYSGKVYNFSVNNTESYSTMSLCVHNCAYPMMNNNETICKLVIFRGGYLKNSSYMKTIYFRNPFFYSCFDTNEEVSVNNIEEVSEPQIIFQESKESEPEYFKTFEEADARAMKWYECNWPFVKSALGI
jgi:hypothetical protein